jgi:hypothetical protein
MQSESSNSSFFIVTSRRIYTFGGGKMNKSRFERWLDYHNHEMELMRTITSAIAAIMGVLVFLRVFGLI